MEDYLDEDGADCLEEYHYATTTAYSPTMSELPLKGTLEVSFFRGE